MKVETIVLIISICVSSVAIGNMARMAINAKYAQRQLRKDAEDVLRDIDRIINDTNAYSDEEIYEVDLSLKSYFDENRVKIQELANRLQARQPALSFKDPSLPKLGKLLEWVLRDFYHINQEEEERIRIWSQNIQNYHQRKNDIIARS